MIVEAKCLFCQSSIKGERDYMLSGTGLRKDGRRKPKWLKARPEFHWTWNGIDSKLFFLCPNHKSNLSEAFEIIQKVTIGR